MPLQPEVVLTAYAGYAAIVMGVLLWNVRDRGPALRRLDEPRPGRHVLHEGRAQALIRQVFGRHR